MTQPTAIVIGAGIVGLAHARALALRGFKVLVFERNPQAVGASVRNFGMVWPIGQPDGTMYNRAFRSRIVWEEICVQAGLWHDKAGSLHLATTPTEAEAMQAIAAHYADSRGTQWLDKTQVVHYTKYARESAVLGALWSPQEMMVEARDAIQGVAAFLHETYAVDFAFNTAISKIEGHTVWSGSQSWKADLIFICSGTDFETLYPAHFQSLALTKCKLQMMRLQPLPANQKFGPALCGGLSLIHYKGFEVAPQLPALKQYYGEQYPQQVQWGIHVMACQSPDGGLTIGDTHEYGLHQDPFDKQFLNQMVLDYLGTFSTLNTLPVAQTWNGIYAKMTNGQSEHVDRVAENTYVVTGLGGAGMTLSFGLAEELVFAL